MLFRTIYFIFLFTLKYWILKKISVRLRFANLNLKFSSGLNFEIQIKIKKKKFEFISINSKLKKKTYKIHFCLLTRILNNLFSNHRNYIALPNFIRSILRANDNTHRFNLFAMSSRHFSSLYLSIYIYIYYIEQKRRCYLVLEWNQKRRGEVTFRWTIRIPAGSGGEQWRLRRERLPCLDVSFPPAGRKFPFPYGGVCLSLAAGQTGQMQGKEGKNGRESRREESQKQVGVKEFKYTLEIKICLYANA